MSTAAVTPGSPGGLPCPSCNPPSVFCQRGDPLWYCQAHCEDHRENGGRCWGVNHPASCMRIVEEITAMIFLKKGVSPGERPGEKD